MIISRAPLRVSLAGGGSDLPSFFQEGGGAVFSVAIDQYVYVAVHKHFAGGYRLKYSKTEDVKEISEIQHPLIREVLQEIRSSEDLEIASFADVPSTGSGLGSSSAFTIALLNAVSSFNGENLSQSELANLACKIEIEKCKEPIGKQDQFASAYGGINHFVFNSDGTTEVYPSQTFFEDKTFLESCLSLYYLGFGRSASQILSEQSLKMKTHHEARLGVEELARLVSPIIDAVKKKDSKMLGEVMRTSWDLKRSLTSATSNPQIDSIISSAREAGATGAKVVGAGGGGFLLLTHDEGSGTHIEKKFNQLQRLHFSIAQTGAEIVYRDKTEGMVNG